MGHPVVFRDPDQIFLWYCIAVALTHLEDIDNAKAAYERAMQLDQKDPAIPVNYANLLFSHAQVKDLNKDI